MTWFTVLKRDQVPAIEERWSIVAAAVDEETADAALESVIGDSEKGGAGEYMIVTVAALKRVKAQTAFTIEAMEPPDEGPVVAGVPMVPQ